MLALRKVDPSEVKREGESVRKYEKSKSRENEFQINFQRNEKIVEKNIFPKKFFDVKDSLFGKRKIFRDWDAGISGYRDDSRSSKGLKSFLNNFLRFQYP